MGFIGNTEWTKLSGNAADNKSNDLTIGSDGSIYITGTSRANLNGQTSNGLDDAFISKFNSNGEIQWTRLLGTSTVERRTSISIGSDLYEQRIRALGDCVCRVSEWRK